MAGIDEEGWRAAIGKTVLGEVEFHELGRSIGGVDPLNVEISRV
jgi:hypothetical protein